jgi:hypothetical protein
MSTRIVNLPSGSIDIVHDGPLVLLQFNCSCADALPYCHGMCCSMQMAYSAEMTQEESNRLGSRVVNEKLVLPVLDNKPWQCKYQSDINGLCTVHDMKPENCKNWHCSPQGMGEGITKRAQGWVMLPTQGGGA